MRRCQVTARRCGLAAADVRAAMASEASQVSLQAWRKLPGSTVKTSVLEGDQEEEQEAEEQQQQKVEGQVATAATAGAGAEGADGHGPGAAAVPRPLLFFVKRHTREEALAYATAVQNEVPMTRLAPLAFLPLGSAGGGDADSGTAPAAAAPGGRLQAGLAQQAPQPEARQVPPPAGSEAEAQRRRAGAPPGLPPDLEALLLVGNAGDAAWGADAAELAALAADGDPAASRALPPVASPAADPAAAYVLQFDGASRNNPGRASWAYVLLRGHEARTRVGQGCMTLAYGTGAALAEYWGLVMGLEAAAAAGVRNLLVEVGAARGRGAGRKGVRGRVGSGEAQARVGRGQAGV
jgi:hypothetical protein